MEQKITKLTTANWGGAPGLGQHAEPEKSNLVQTNIFCESFNLPKSIVLYYVREGLLTPDKIDIKLGGKYFYWDLEKQEPVISKIKKLKEEGKTISEMKKEFGWTILQVHTTKGLTQIIKRPRNIQTTGNLWYK